MSDLLTRDEYAAIAARLTLPTQAFVDGAFRPAQSGKTFESVNPATGVTIAHAAACGPEDVDFAAGKAREALEDGRWSKLPPAERKDVLIRLCKLITRSARELAVLESVDSGKTIFDCETVDVPETIHCLKWHAEAIDKIYDQVSPASDDHLAVIVREPVGVAGLVLPWNFPLLMLAWKIGPALATGNSVVVKPAEETSLTALRIAELALEAGVPRGVFNVVPGLGPDVGESLGRHDDVDMISFTGSTETGRRFLRYAADSNLKDVVLEMGGKNPCIVLENAENLDRVAAHIVNGAFWNMGENCSATSRLIVHHSCKDELLERILAHAREWTMGDPLDPFNSVGALVSKTHFDKVSSYLTHAEAGQPIAGGGTGTVFLSSRPSSTCIRTKAFWPAKKSSGRSCRSSRLAVSTRRSRWPTIRATVSPRRSSPVTASERCAARVPSGPAPLRSTATGRATSQRPSAAATTRFRHTTSTPT